MTQSGRVSLTWTDRRRNGPLSRCTRRVEESGVGPAVGGRRGRCQAVAPPGGGDRSQQNPQEENSEKNPGRGLTRERNRRILALVFRE